MTTAIEQTCYYWQRDGAWQIGTPALVDGGEVDRHVYLDVNPGPEPRYRTDQLMRLCHTGELTWVPVDELKLYPAEPIPEPGE